MSESPEFPPIPELTVSQAHRIICADWLESVARMVRQGSVTAFDIAWNSDLEKPVGKFLGNASLLIGPIEPKLKAAVAAERQRQIDATTQVVDFTEQLKDHEPCEGEAKEQCALCKTTYS